MQFERVAVLAMLSSMAANIPCCLVGLRMDIMWVLFTFSANKLESGDLPWLCLHYRSVVVEDYGYLVKTHVPQQK